MILRIPVGADWTTHPVENGLLHSRGPLTVRALRIREQPDDPVLWMRHAALKGAPAKTAFTLQPATKVRTADGWSAILQESELTGDGFHQHRIVVLYVFVDYAAGAVVHMDAAHVAAHRMEILDLLGKASPDWGTQETACLARVFDGVGTVKAWEASRESVLGIEE